MILDIATCYGTFPLITRDEPATLSLLLFASILLHITTYYCSDIAYFRSLLQLIIAYYQLVYHYCWLLRDYCTITSSVTAWFLHITSLLSHYNLLLRNNGFITTCYYVVMVPLLPVSTVVLGSLLLITKVYNN